MGDIPVVLGLDSPFQIVAITGAEAECAPPGRALLVGRWRCACKAVCNALTASSPSLQTATCTSRTTRTSWKPSRRTRRRWRPCAARPSASSCSSRSASSRPCARSRPSLTRYSRTRRRPWHPSGKGTARSATRHAEAATSHALANHHHVLHHRRSDRRASRASKPPTGNKTGAGALAQEHSVVSVTADGTSLLSVPPLPHVEESSADFLRTELSWISAEPSAVNVARAQPWEGAGADRQGAGVSALPGVHGGRGGSRGEMVWPGGVSRTVQAGTRTRMPSSALRLGKPLSTAGKATAVTLEKSLRVLRPDKSAQSRTSTAGGSAAHWMMFEVTSAGGERGCPGVRRSAMATCPVTLLAPRLASGTHSLLVCLRRSCL